MADAVTRRAEDFGGWAIVSAAPAAALLAFLLVGGWWWAIVGLAGLLLSLVLVRLVARTRAPSNFVEACCHRIDGVLRAGPPTTKGDR